MLIVVFLCIPVIPVCLVLNTLKKASSNLPDWTGPVAGGKAGHLAAPRGALEALRVGARLDL